MRWPLIGTLTAIAVTTAMDAGGLPVFSALPLLPLAALLWLVERHGRTEIGLAWGRPRDYAAAALYPVIVLGTATLVAFLAAAVDLSETDWRKFWLNFLAGGGSSKVGALGVTEAWIFGPEVGLVGLALNGAYATALWLRLARTGYLAGS